MSLQKIATIVASLTAFLLMTIKLVVGFISGSIAVLSSAIDSLLDLFVSIFNYLAIKNSEKDTDKLFNYGRGKIEALATLFEGLVICLSGAYIFYLSCIKFVHPTQLDYLGISLLVMVISVIITFGLVYFLEYVAKKTDNLVIKSDALHYKMDLLTNGGILLALVIIYYTGFHEIDAIFGILISLYIMYTSYELIKKGFLLILDISLDKKEVEKIKEIIKNTEKITDYHFLRTREAGKYKFVDVHLVFNIDIKLIDAHTISDTVEEKISLLDTWKERIFNIHLDPLDDSIVVDS